MKKCISLGPFCVLLLAVALYSCSTAYRNFEDCHNTIVFHNQSGKAIYYASTLKEGFLNYDPTRPDHAADALAAAICFVTHELPYVEKGRFR